MWESGGRLDFSFPMPYLAHDVNEPAPRGLAWFGINIIEQENES